MKNRKKEILIGIVFIFLSVLVFLFFCSEFYTSKSIRSIGGVKNNGGVSQFKNNNVSGGTSVSSTKKFKFSTWNNFCYLTQISNGLLGIWSLIFGICNIFNLKSMKEKVTHPFIICSLSTLLSFVGIVVAGSLITGIYRLQVWTNKYFVLVNIRDIFYHIITPIIAVLLAIFINDDRKLEYKESKWLLVLPLTYVVFTYIRGKLILKTWYPYFIFDSYKVWNVLGLGEYNKILAYLLLFGIMFVIAILYNFLAKLVIKMKNKDFSLSKSV